MSQQNYDRRKFIVSSAQSVGLMATGGALLGGYVTKAKSSPLVLRPPGAIKEVDFLTACVKCGLCSEACKNRDSNIDKNTGSSKEPTLKIAKAGDERLIGTPYFVPRDIPCYMCPDIPCVPVCPSGALDIKSVLNSKNELDINKSKMGLAVVDRESCVAFWGIQCDACYRACPLLDKAITLEYQKNERTGKHAYLLPIVHSDVCTGCGLCEKACITQKPAIFILPLDIAKGEVGSHYVKGWDVKDQNRLKDAQDFSEKTGINQKSALDYLNSKDNF